jgi:hypothetical protein
MPASGRLDVHPPPLHGELSVSNLSAVGDEVWAVGMRGAPAPAIIAQHRWGPVAGGLVFEFEQGRAHPARRCAGHRQRRRVGRRLGGPFPLEHRTYPHRPRRGDDRQPVESPDFGDSSHLSDVAAWGRDDAFAVGARTSDSSLPGGPVGLPPVAAWDTLAVRWDGARWAVVPGPGRGTLHEVSAIGQGAYWAVGPTALAERSGNISMVTHYADGHWQQVGFEGVGPLFGVAATGPDDVWAVGQDQDPSHVGGALILHYDGHAWAPAETPVVGQARLSGVACAGPDNVWAVGAQHREDGAFGPLILHFDGSVWAAVEPPATAAPKGLSAVIALPDGAAWAAGGFSAAGDTGYTIPPVVGTRGGH